MKQKIEVQVTADADEQWPILRGSSETFPGTITINVGRDAE